VVALLFISLASCRLRSDEELAREAVVVENVPGQKLRAYEANVFPAIGPPRAVQLKGVALEKDGNKGTIDAVEFDINTWSQLALAFGYFHAEGQVPNNANDTSGGEVSASAFAFLLRAFAVVEFDDNNGVAGYQKDSNDTVNGVYDLSHPLLQWKPLVANKSEVTNSDGQTFKVWYITAETVDEVFYIRFIVAGTPLSVSGVHITPDGCKVDFAIRWFTEKHVRAFWTPGPSPAIAHPNAQVGLVSAMAALAETADAKSGTTDANPQVQFGAAGNVGYFSWAPNADVVVQGVEASRGVFADVVVNNNDANINAAFKAGWIIRVLYFSFDGKRPSEVSWDPEFGSQIDYTSTASSSTTNAIVVAFFALLVLLA